MTATMTGQASIDLKFYGNTMTTQRLYRCPSDAVCEGHQGLKITFWARISLKSAYPSTASGRLMILSNINLVIIISVSKLEKRKVISC